MKYKYAFAFAFSVLLLALGGPVAAQYGGDGSNVRIFSESVSCASPNSVYEINTCYATDSVYIDGSYTPGYAEIYICVYSQTVTGIVTGTVVGGGKYQYARVSVDGVTVLSESSNSACDVNSIYASSHTFEPRDGYYLLRAGGSSGTSMGCESADMEAQIIFDYCPEAPVYDPGMPAIARTDGPAVLMGLPEEGLLPLEYEKGTTGLENPLGFEDIWQMGRIGLTLYQMVESSEAWPYIIIFIIVLVAASAIIKLIQDRRFNQY